MAEEKLITIRLARIRVLLVLLGVGVMLFGLGYTIGQNNRGSQALWRSQNDSSATGELRFNSLEVSGDQPASINANLDLFWHVWTMMDELYIDRKDVTDEDLVYGAISGMVSAAGDPYTVFLPPDDNERSRADLRGSFSGVGIQLGYKDDPDTEFVERQLAVIAPLDGMPAKAAGVKSGDYIVAVDGQSTEKMSVPEAVDIIRGPEGTSVTLSLYTKGDSDTHDVELIREEIVVPSVEYEEVSYQGTTVGHLRVSRFGERTMDEVNAAVDQILPAYASGQIAGVVLDLRSNPGGFFQGAINLVSEFVESGVIVQQEDAAGNSEKYRANGQARMKDIPLVVLVNEGSASSSEITAGALKELKGAIVVGKTTFGKGTVQQADNFPDGSGVHITTNRWLLPSGAWIDKVGVSPDVEVEYIPEESTEELDNQLMRAIEEL